MCASGACAVWLGGGLPVPYRVLLPVALLFRLLQLLGVRQRWAAPWNDRWAGLAALAAVLFFAGDFLWLSRDFVDAVVHLLFSALAIKLFSVRTERDHLYLRILSFLTIVAGAMISASASYSFFLVLFLFSGMANFAAGEVRTAAAHTLQVSREGLQAFPARLMKLTSSVSFAVIAVTIVFFFVLPRTTRAALQAWIDPRFHLPGFSGSVTLGQIGEIRLKREPVMHVRLFGEERPARLRWRGAALSKFSGRIWSANVRGKRLQSKKEMQPLVDDAQQRRPGRRLTFEVQLRPTGADTIFVPGIPEFFQIDVPSFFQTQAGTLFSPYLGSRVTRYTGYSIFEDPLAPGAPPYGADRDEYVALPPNVDPRIRALMETWLSRTGTNPKDRAQALTRHLRDEYKYSTQLLDREVADPLSHFLFDRGKGHCEYFASALALMLRLEQIPSRVITGFYGGDYNAISGWYVIRAADAHSWVEAYIDGEGWITLDPTPAATNTNDAFTWFARLNDFFDALETFWQDWVLSYNLDQQVSLAIHAERTSTSAAAKWAADIQSTLSQWWWWFRGLGSPVVLVGTLLVVIALLGPLFVPWLARRWIHHQQRKRLMEGKVTAKDATLLYQRMLEILRLRGLEKPAWLTPREFADLVAGREEGPTVIELTSAYNALRFGPAPGGAARMVELLTTLETLPRA